VARRPRRRIGRRRAAAAALALAVVIGLAVAVSAPLRRQAAGEERREAARQVAVEAAEIRRLRVDARPHRGTGPPRRDGGDALEHRRALVARAEFLITRDAQARSRAGTLTGAVAGTDCEPYPDITARRQAEADPAVPVGRYECYAYKGRIELPELEGGRRQGVLGFPFWAVIDYERGRIVWCKVTPRAGEGGRSLAWVPVPVPCRDPLRRSP
jgi:hypothetical protein